MGQLKVWRCLAYRESDRHSLHLRFEWYPSSVNQKVKKRHHRKHIAQKMQLVTVSEISDVYITWSTSAAKCSGKYWNAEVFFLLDISWTGCMPFFKMNFPLKLFLLVKARPVYNSSSWSHRGDVHSFVLVFFAYSVLIIPPNLLFNGEITLW